MVKLDADGDFLWAWLEGSEGSDFFNDAAAIADGGVVATGMSNGTWNGTASIGDADFAAIKLDSDGDLIWRWQDGTSEPDEMEACVATADGNVVLAGYTQGTWEGVYDDGWNDAVAVKLNVDNGEIIWTYRAGTSNDGGAYVYGSAARADGSVVLCGTTFGSFAVDSFSGEEGSSDFLAIAIDEDGIELWRWQDGSGDGYNYCRAIAAFDDGSVVLAGLTTGSWNGSNLGGYDFAAVKLSAAGVEEWRIQDGTESDDSWTSAAVDNDGLFIVSGYTYGSWASVQTDTDLVTDFVTAGFNDAGYLQWSLQDGTVENDYFNGVTIRPDGLILLAGFTSGTFDDIDDSDSYYDFVALLLDTNTTDMTSSTSVVTISPSTTTTIDAATIPPALIIVTATFSPTTTIDAPTLSPASTNIVVPTPSPTTAELTPSPSLSPMFNSIEDMTPSPDSAYYVTPSDSEDSGTPVEVIVGASGGVVFLAIVGVCLYCCWQRSVATTTAPALHDSGNQVPRTTQAVIGTNAVPAPTYSEPPTYEEPPTYSAIVTSVKNK